MKLDGFGRIMVWILMFMMCVSSVASADISKGSKGNDVMLIQQQLIERGYLSGSADGIFGGQTEKAVKAYQKDMGLPETGIVDATTQTYLNDPNRHAPFFSKAVLECTPAINGDFEEDEPGYNSSKQMVNWSLNILVRKESWMDENTMILATPSWATNPVDRSMDYDLKPAWNNAKKGITSCETFLGYWDDDRAFWHEFYLPDDSSLAGRRWIELEAQGDKAIVYFTLEYKGDYTTGRGWKIADYVFENLTTASMGSDESVQYDGDDQSSIVQAKQYTDGRLSADVALRNIDCYKGCGWMMDPNEADFKIGHNDKGEEVGYGISMYVDMAPSEMTIENVSWTNDLNTNTEGYDSENWWNMGKRGITNVYKGFWENTQSDGSLHTQAGIDIFLPDDPTIAGEQWFTVNCENYRATVRVKLTYNGNYITGLGWNVKQLDVSVSPIT